jgi:hypothetical protein
MPKPGDRVVVEGTKVGGGRREGTLLEMSGPLMKIRWNEGGESIMAPGAGAITFLPGSARAAKAKSSAPKSKSKAPTKGKAPARGKKK